MLSLTSIVWKDCVANMTYNRTLDASAVALSSQKNTSAICSENLWEHKSTMTTEIWLENQKFRSAAGALHVRPVLYRSKLSVGVTRRNPAQLQSFSSASHEQRREVQVCGPMANSLPWTLWLNTISCSSFHSNKTTKSKDWALKKCWFVVIFSFLAQILRLKHSTHY